MQIKASGIMSIELSIMGKCSVSEKMKSYYRARCTKCCETLWYKLPQV